jgi:N-acetylglucosaminyldiphosphoundecaprenol N-acetyl-beta-D-mannosaminyltransferase
MGFGSIAMASRVDLLRVHIDPVDLPVALSMARNAVQTRRPHQFVTVNVDFLKLAKRDPAFRRLLNTSDLVVADGMPLLWASRLLGTPIPSRITGTDLVLGCASMANAHGYSIFLLGAQPGVAEAAARVLGQQYPRLRICGTYAPPLGPFTSDEDARMVHQIRAAAPDFLFVAFGAPRQDVWIREHMAELGVPVSVGIGGVLNFIAGTVRRAPGWMQHSGLEWLFRMSQEPGRLWRRYLVEDLPIFLELLAQPRLDLPESTWVLPREPSSRTTSAGAKAGPAGRVAVR